jgi:hypothetical protein
VARFAEPKTTRMEQVAYIYRLRDRGIAYLRALGKETRPRWLVVTDTLIALELLCRPGPRGAAIVFCAGDLHREASGREGRRRPSRSQGCTPSTSSGKPRPKQRGPPQRPQHPRRAAGTAHNNKRPNGYSERMRWVNRGGDAEALLAARPSTARTPVLAVWYVRTNSRHERAATATMGARRGRHRLPHCFKELPHACCLPPERPPP